jgi:hypothetical protein
MSPFTGTAGTCAPAAAIDHATVDPAIARAFLGESRQGSCGAFRKLMWRLLKNWFLRKVGHYGCAIGGLQDVVRHASGNMKAAIEPDRTE